MCQALWLPRELVPVLSKMEPCVWTLPLTCTLGDAGADGAEVHGRATYSRMGTWAQAGFALPLRASIRNVSPCLLFARTEAWGCLGRWTLPPSGEGGGMLGAG